MRRPILVACFLLTASLVSGALAQAAVTAPNQGTEIPPLSGAPISAAPEWLPRGTAEVQALDKINARHVVLPVKVGSSAEYGSLTIAVQACVVRGPSQPADAAAYLVITDKHEGEPGFRGWMVASDPSVSMLEHPIYDVRIIGCLP